jgi:hypothetical protein
MIMKSLRRAPERGSGAGLMAEALDVPEVYTDSRDW